MTETILQLFRNCSRSVFALFIAILLFNQSATAAPDGKALFTSNCAACHNPLKDATGPALKDIDKTFPSKEWGYKWVNNSQALVTAGDKDAVAIFNKFNKIPMTAFPSLSHEDIDAILKYVDEFKDPNAKKPGTETPVEAKSNSSIYTWITLGLIVIAIGMWRLSSTLRKSANDKSGIPNYKDIPLGRNKVVIAMVVILGFIFVGYWITNGAINEGRQQNYQPVQPIFYSHKVHAGINQINCQYCHAGAEKSKQAMIPSVNVCMNCHKQINEYSGAADHPLVTTEGKTVNGTEEIKKLYAAAGWDPTAKAYIKDEKGNIKTQKVEWVKIHNLPDHVYFNHSQHVKVGKVQCQQCHGEITEMDEVYQFAPLSMGWCVNCHRQTGVQFDNGYYNNVYKKYHEEMKSGARTKVTVDDIGGTECQKCHY